MSILFDLVVLGILGFFIWRGASRGFVLTLCGLVAVVVALVGASFLSNALAEPAADLVEPMISARIQTALDDSIQSSEFTTETGAAAEDADSISLVGVVEQLKESKLFAGFAESFQKAVSEGTAQVVTSAARSVAHYAAVQIAHGVIFALGFVILLLVWFLLSHALVLVARLPGLNSLNKLGGGAIGFLKGCIVLFILAWLCRVCGWQLPADVVEKTHLLRFFLETNPVGLLTGA